MGAETWKDHGISPTFPTQPLLKFHLGFDPSLFFFLVGTTHTFFSLYVVLMGMTPTPASKVGIDLKSRKTATSSYWCRHGIVAQFEEEESQRLLPESLGRGALLRLRILGKT